MFVGKPLQFDKKYIEEKDCGLRFRFQPVYIPRTEKIFGYECLLRIVDPLYGELRPSDFLPHAQKHNHLMVRLEDWAIAELVKASNEMKNQHLQYEMLSLNINSDSLFDDGFIDRMVRLLGDEYDNGNLWLEFKTDVLLKGRDALENLTDLRALGVKVVMDAFSEPLLSSELPADMVKIDKKLVATFLTNRLAEKKILKILNYAKEQGVDVTAMGVENAHQEKRLLAMGVNKMQGFYYCKPLFMQNAVCDQEE